MTQPTPSDFVDVPFLRPRLAMSLILMLSSVIVWWIVFGLGTIIVEVLSGKSETTQRENIVMSEEGQVLVEATEISATSFRSTSRRRHYKTLEGRILGPQEEPVLSTESNTNLIFRREQDTVSNPVRAVPFGFKSFHNHQAPDQYWYFCFTNGKGNSERGYFEVFDSRSQQRLFYLGKAGETEMLPAPEEQFDFPDSSTFGQENVLLPSYQEAVIPLGRPARYAHSEPISHILLLSEAGELWRIDYHLGKVIKLPGISGVQGLKRGGFRFLRPEEDGENLYIGSISDWWHTAEEITFQLIHSSEQKYVVKIPETLQRHPQLAFRFLPDGNILYQAQRWDQNTLEQSTDLFWADREGNIVKEHSAVLVTTHDRERRKHLLTMASIWPNPLGFLLTLLENSNVERISAFYGIKTSRREKFWKNVQTGWDLILGICGMAIVSVVLYWKKCQRKSMFLSWWHLLFILLFGPFAFFSLWLQQKSTPVELPVSENQAEGIAIVRPVESVLVG